jgi:rare lipoprotein A
MPPARRWTVPALLFLCCCGSISTPAAAAHKGHKTHKAHKAHEVPAHTPDSSGRQRGKASVYSRQLAHHRMADGTPLDLESNAAASKTLPLGSKARVTNLRNGRSAVVVIRDRGPFVKGRIIDLTPHTAAELHFRSRGVVAVEVARIVPEPAIKPAKNQRGHVEPVESDVFAGPVEPGVIDLLICSRQSAGVYQLLSLCR